MGVRFFWLLYYCGYTGRNLCGIVIDQRRPTYGTLHSYTAYLVTSISIFFFKIVFKQKKL